MRKHFGLSAVAAAVALSLPLIASAQVKVGVTIAATGPAASLGIPERNTVALLPRKSTVPRSNGSCSTTPPIRRKP